jgi:hypothetical protein
MQTKHRKIFCICKINQKTQKEISYFQAPSYTVGLLICTLISENQGLLQTIEKFQVLQNLDFFQISSIKTSFRKKCRFARPEIFLRFETDLDFSRT